MCIEWDPAKARSNMRKHGVSFSDVEPAFYDDCALAMLDDRCTGEERHVLIGTDALGRIVTVSYTYREANIRIISARRATRAERREYAKRV